MPCGNMGVPVREVERAVAQTREPQAILMDPVEAAIFLVLCVKEGAEGNARDLLADVGGLIRSVGFRAPDGGLGCVVGVGSALWDRLFGSPRPADLHQFAGISGARHTAVATPGDLLFHIRAHRADLCFELAQRLVERLRASAKVLEEVHGFKSFDERDLLGFVDGTENPVGAAAPEAVVIAEEDPDFAGGSYVLVQRYLHDLTTWDRLTVGEQEQIVGRTKLGDIELPDDVKPATRTSRSTRSSTPTADSNRSSATTCRSDASAMASSVPTSSATRATRT